MHQDIQIWKAISITITFFIIIIMVSKKIHIGFSMLTGCLCFSLLIKDPILLLNSIKATLINPTFWYLIAVVYSVLILNNITSHAGYLNGLLNTLTKIIKSPRVIIAIPPALVGLLPMPAGALFTAEVTKSVGEKIGATPEEMTYVNYWWRHIWEYSWPLYTAIILESAIIGVHIKEIVKHQLHLTITATIAGIIFSIPIRKHIDSSTKKEKLILKDLIKYIWPFVIIITFALGSNIPLWIITTITAIAVYILAENKIPLKELIKRLDYKLFIALLGIFIFKEMLQTSKTINIVSHILIASGMPKTVLLFVLPMLVSFTTGITTSFVALAFPLLLGIMNNDFTAIAWAFTGGYVGHLISPMHLCFALSKEYFGASWLGVYRLLLPPLILIIVVSLTAYKLF